MSDGVAVRVENVVCRYGETVAVDDVSLDVREGEFVSLLGPSGCGKTTLLRAIAGFQPVAAGRILVTGRDITAAPPHRRPVHMVFQRYALFPHKSVADNVGFALELRGVGRRERQKRAQEMLELVRLPDFGERAVDELSGGQAQRVALARALVTDPPVLLLDEPLAALDLKLRQAMQLELRELQQRVGSTFIFVTHDQEEAMVMSDRIMLMDGGKLVQSGTPEEIYRRPATLFASTFLGEANVFHGSVAVDDGRTVLRSGDLTLSLPEAPSGAGEGAIALRPELIGITAADGAVDGELDRAVGEVLRVVFLGSVVRYIVRVGDRQVLVQSPGGLDERRYSEGDRVVLSWSPAAVVPVRA
jgi:ABC-type Fe3+/spermidine/putrescine transport system ATPase subunit